MPLEVLLTVAGDQLPLIPFVEVVGKAGAVPPLQIFASAVKSGAILGFTVWVSVAVVAHCPAPGVKVYVPLEVLLTVAGDQLPLIPLLEVAGKAGAVPPLQISASAVKPGVILGLTVCVRVAVVAH